MSVAIAVPGTASAPIPAEPALPAALACAQGEGADRPFAEVFDAALAAPGTPGEPADVSGARAQNESGPTQQVTDPASIFGLMPALAGSPAPGAPSDPGIPAAGSGAIGPDAAATAAGTPGVGPALGLAPQAARGSRATGVGPDPVAAATVADPEAATTAGGGTRVPGAAAEGRLRADADTAATRIEATRAESAGGRTATAGGSHQPVAGIDAAGGGLAGSAPAASAPPVTTVLGTPVGRPEWGGAVGERIGWLASQRVQVAEIQLTPAHLGPVEVRITVEKDVATIALAAAHAPVREALQASLPRLAEALAGGGLQLGQASVGAESFLGGSPQDRGSGRGSPEAPAPAVASAQASAGAMRLQPLAAALARGGIDLFA